MLWSFPRRKQLFAGSALSPNGRCGEHNGSVFKPTNCFNSGLFGTPASCRSMSAATLPFRDLASANMLVCSYARVFAWMQTNHVSGLHPRCCRRPKQGSKPNGAKATSQPCLALLTGGSSLPAAKSGLFQTLNDPSPPLSSHLIRASPGSLDAAGVGAGCAGWMSLPG